MLKQILRALFEHIAVSCDDILSLFVACFDKLADFRVNFGSDILGVISPLRIISAEENLVTFVAVKDRTELLGEAIAHYHIPCNARCAFDIV